MNNTKPWTILHRTWANEQNLPAWGRLLQSWVQVHANYCAAVPGDNAWYYREHPARGLLGAAAFLAGGVSLQEWPVGKGIGGEGRNDLWLRLIPQTNQGDFYIEAKHDWIVLLDSDPDKRALLSLEFACADASKIRSPDTPVLGILFGSLVATIEARHDDLKQAADKLFEHARKTLKCDACATLLFDAESWFGFVSNRTAKEKPETVGVALFAKRLGSK